jgi:hypothetical protein
MSLRALRSRLSPRRSDRMALLHHRLSGSPVPPPHRVKRYWLARLARRYRCRTLVETGTYQGDMVAAMLPVFRRIVTIELDPGLAEAAVRRFRDRPEVTVVHGDAGRVLDRVLEELDERCAFWLDGHHSGPGTALGARPTPILAELEAIGRHARRDHMILIDDARCFGNEAGYPSIATLLDVLRSINPSYATSVRDDAIRALPPRHRRAALGDRG